MYYKIKDVSIRWQILIICIILIVIPVTIISVNSYISFRADTIKNVNNWLTEQVSSSYRSVSNVSGTTKEQLKVALSAARLVAIKGLNSLQNIELQDSTAEFVVYDQVTKAPKNTTIRLMTINGKPVLNDYNYVDRIKREIGLAVTFLQVVSGGLLRISTNIKNNDGTRAVGTLIDENTPEYQHIVNGEKYFGRAFVMNDWYMTAFEPVKLKDGTIIGALFTGFPEKATLDIIFNDFTKVNIGKSGYMWILNNDGEYLLNKLDTLVNKSDTGTDTSFSAQPVDTQFVKLILDSATHKGDGKPFLLKKMAKGKSTLYACVYFEEWKWVIGCEVKESEFMGELKKVTLSTIIIALLCIVGGSFIAYLFAVSITGTLTKVVDHLHDIGNGNLTDIDTSSAGKNELGRSLLSLQNMVENLRLIIHEISSAIITITQTSKKLAEQSSSIASGSVNVTDQTALVGKSTEQGHQNIESIAAATEEMSSSMSMIAASMEEMNARINEVARNCQREFTISESAVQKTQEIQGMIDSLSKTVGKIGKVIDIINKIARQTNLLSLNASIEASSAGEAGKGFAIVAGEVKQLAQQTAQATRDIKEQVTTIQNSTGDVIGSINEIIETIAEIASISKIIVSSVEQQSSTVNEVAKNMDGSKLASQEIAQNVSESADGLKTITLSIDNVRNANHKTANEVACVNNEVKGLLLLSEKLSDIVKKFKLV